MTIWLLLILAVFCSTFLTWLLRLYALKNSLMDIPNQRSSHSISTPRGGGIAIVVTFLFCLLVLFLLKILLLNELIAFAGAAIIIAGIGFWDDHGHVAAGWRLAFHFLAAAWGLYWLDGLPPIVIYKEAIELGWIGVLLALLYLVWLLNLYNFMDGIDGIASIEAVTVCLGAILLYLISSPERSLLTMAAVMLTSTIGFLIWNFPPAKIFMGDAGSGFIGLTLGLLSIHATIVDPVFLSAWLILLGAFIVDASLTLFFRVLNGDSFYEAHRSHAYQYASRKLKSHKVVTLAFAFINLFWLLPIAICVVMNWINSLFALVVAYLPLVIGAYLLKAGRRLQQDAQ